MGIGFEKAQNRERISGFWKCVTFIAMICRAKCGNIGEGEFIVVKGGKTEKHCTNKGKK